MYKALLIDDEDYDLEGLNKLIPWSDLNIEIVCSVNKPLLALEYIRAHPVDILITDIKMPVLSGLELAKKALEYQPSLNIIFISGYEDFQYAKEALLLKASGYILKPVDDDEVISLVKSTVARLDSENKKHRAAVSLKQSFHYVKGNFITHLLEGTLEEDKLSILLEEYGLELHDCGMIAVLVEIDDVILKLNSMTLEQQRCELQAILQYIADYTNNKQLGWHCKLSHFQMGLVLKISAEYSIEDQMNQLVLYIKQSSALSITVGLGFEVNEAKLLWKSYHHAKEMLNFKMFLGKNRIITSQSSKMGLVAGAKDLNEILEMMFTAMENYELVKIDDGIEDLFFLAKSFEHRFTVYNFAIHIISKLESHLNKRNETFLSLLGWDRDHLELIYKFETIEDIKSWLRRMMFEISEIIYMKRDSKNSRFFDEVLKYVNSKPYSDVTLRDVANYFSYSPNHLGFLFKEHFSESFSDYIIRIRMEKAEQLLLNPVLKVYEIADQLGYKSLTYFSRQFREYYGTSPGDFRKQG